MQYKSKANRIGNKSLAALGVRLIDTVVKSGIPEAASSKQYLVLLGVNNRYQTAIYPDNMKQYTDNINLLYKNRRNIFDESFVYVKGLTKSPVADIKEAALLVFSQLNKYGYSYSGVPIADQTVQYIRVIEGLKRPEFTSALAKISLTDKLAQLDQAQMDYEDLYLNRGNYTSTRLAPSNLRKEMQDAVKLYVDELKWMANANDTEEWHTLYTNVEQRFNEVNVNITRKKESKPAETVVAPAV